MKVYDETMFFNIVQTMPNAIEALDLCKRARQTAISDMQKLRLDGLHKEAVNIDGLITRLNDEIKYINRFLVSSSFEKACKEIVGHEMFLLIMERASEIRMERMDMINEGM